MKKMVVNMFQWRLKCHIMLIPSIKRTTEILQLISQTKIWTGTHCTSEARVKLTSNWTLMNKIHRLIKSIIWWTHWILALINTFYIAYVVAQFVKRYRNWYVGNIIHALYAESYQGIIFVCYCKCVRVNIFIYKRRPFAISEEIPHWLKFHSHCGWRRCLSENVAIGQVFYLRQVSGGIL